MTRTPAPECINIGTRRVAADTPCYVIAEIGNNHNGSVDRAFELVDAAVAAGADCAKFQMRKLSEVYRASSLSGADDDLSVEYTLDLLKRFELSVEDQLRVRDYCRQKGITYLCTPWDPSSVRELDAFGVEAFKVASADLTNLPLLDAIAATGKPIVVSTGMSRRFEIEAATRFLQERGASFVLLHCQSTYPAAFHNINLRFMETLREIHPLVGYSGHERGVAVTIGAVALGAIVVERHLTLDRQMEGPDHAASLEPAEFAALVKGMREVEEARGVVSINGERPLSQGELINRETLAKSLVAGTAIAAGDVITASDVLVRSPGQGLSPLRIDELIGRVATRAFKPDDYFYASDLDGEGGKIEPYRFSRPWGVPVRYHDAEQFMRAFKPDMVEFHLSYKDMERDPAEYLTTAHEEGFVVHAPELFENSRLMDLATPDDELRAYSLKETQRVIDITRSLKRFFPRTERPCIVANVGGFTMDAPLDESEKAERYRLFFESLRQLDTEGVEFTPQTMAPFPWHFGGQRHQNIFIFPDECAEACERHGLRMTLDVSHTLLAANHFGFDFMEGMERLGPYVAHLHLGDSSGVDGEGLQIGDGELDFAELGRILKRTAPTASFIPEIWQGHKNTGEGFRVALERLEGLI